MIPHPDPSGVTSAHEVMEELSEGIVHFDPRDDARLVYLGQERDEKGRKRMILECENHSLRFYHPSGNYNDLKTIKLSPVHLVSISHELQVKLHVNPDYRLAPGDFVFYDVQCLERYMKPAGKVSKIEIIIEKKK